MRAATRFYSVQANLQKNPIIETAQEFKIPLNTDLFAFVTYETSDNVYNLVHSSVPEQLKGKGLGTILAQVNYDK